MIPTNSNEMLDRGDRILIVKILIIPGESFLVKYGDNGVGMGEVE